MSVSQLKLWINFVIIGCHNCSIDPDATAVLCSVKEFVDTYAVVSFHCLISDADMKGHPVTSKGTAQGNR